MKQKNQYQYVSKYLRLVALSFLLNACSSSAYLIQSNPEGAEVTTLSGEVVGKTPLSLKGEEASRLGTNGVFNFKVSSPGYIPRVIVANGNSTREITVVLPKSDDLSFRSDFSNDFSKELNKSFREGFNIQKLLSEGKFLEAKIAVEKFKSEHPQLAFGYVISASLYLRDGKREAANRDLLRAQTLDPDDSSITQSLKLISGSITSTAKGGS